MAWFWQKKKDEQVQADAKQQKAEQKKQIRERAGKKEGTSASAKSSDKKTASGDTRVADQILFGPIVTEKAARLAEERTYGFFVAPTANKVAISHAVAEVYGVHPVNVSVVNTHAKPKNFAQQQGIRSSLRKAYVTLKQGESIELFEQ